MSNANSDKMDQPVHLHNLYKSNAALRIYTVDYI